ncbi:S8 family serine peptidase, partial [Candidatus Woesearchaeota archaeon]|nr:S8 family serine peptidase [Candidatus Woesearchaeota archaeon]
GYGICSTRLPGDNDGSVCGDGTFISKSGTSMSTPHVAGAAALIKQFVRLQDGTDITPQEIEDVLNDTGVQIYDGATERNYSRIDVYAAILSLDTTPPNVTFVNMTPENETITSNTFIFVNVTVNDSLNNISSCLLEWNYTSNNTITKVGNGISIYCYENKSIIGTGIFYYRVYANDSVNNIGVSELRQINITNTAPNATNVTINSTDALNRTNSTLTGSWDFYDANGDNQLNNETKWYNNSIEVITLANLTVIGSGNTTKNQNWTFSVRVFDGKEWSEWINSTVLTIKNSAPTQPSLTNPENESIETSVNVTINWSDSTDADNDAINYSIHFLNTSP